MFDLLVIGEINPDLIIQGSDVVPAFGQAEKLVEEATLTIGSSSVIMACGAARLGLKVAFIGLIGEDEFGRFMLRGMQQRGIDTSACVVDPTVQTGMSVILSGTTDRAILTYPGAIPLLKREQINGLSPRRSGSRILTQARHLHVGGYFLLDNLRPDLPTLFAAAKQHDMSTSLDTNWDPRERWDVAAMFPHCDLFLPNEEEVLHITQQADFAAGLDDLAAQIPTLAVKMGAKGGMAKQGETAVTSPPLKVNVIDTTGAGDSFDAGFIYGYLHSWTLQKSLHLATACGSLSTRAAGGTSAQPALAEALTHLDPKGFDKK
ncbi:Ribokinase [hydrothermal vent metagenome]|uniref:Ribokinase n=1 Tax=hydrothermal vent metagenome TaxID=652676 RepID=A0A3B0VX12_9ZZZZ